MSGLDLRAEIERLRKERNAVILAHYYQKPEIQDLADFVGDSLDLSRKAQATDADVIAFCGVRFMAETAKILSPQKTVVLPDMDAGCSLEDSCPPEQFAAFRAQHPDAIALTYINCSAAVKALRSPSVVFTRTDCGSSRPCDLRSSVTRPSPAARPGTVGSRKHAREKARRRPWLQQGPDSPLRRSALPR